MHVFRAVALVVVLAALPTAVSAGPVTIDFESLSDLESVTNQFPGLTFTNATVLTAGISLNEFEFPPVSGSNVVFDDGGGLSISFSTSIHTFSAFFTYLAPLTLTAFDINGNLIGTVSSVFGSNLALSGQPGSTPNELLAFSSLTAIASITISGDPFGGSFTLDNFTYNTAVPTHVPEPSTFSLLGAGVLGAIVLRRRRSQRSAGDNRLARQTYFR
jgi:hypothetical protein